MNQTNSNLVPIGSAQTYQLTALLGNGSEIEVEVDTGTFISIKGHMYSGENDHLIFIGRKGVWTAIKRSEIVYMEIKSVPKND